MTDLRNVYWMGGSPCAGKSTICERLAEKYSLNYYCVDSHYEAHLARADAVRHPNVVRLRSITWNDVFLRPVQDLLRDEIAFYHEVIELIVEDLRRLPSDQPVVAEGAALLPELVAPYLPDIQHGLWVVPTETFQREHYSKRPWIHAILAETRDPAQAFENWMCRDARFAEYVRAGCAERGFEVIVVDGEAGLEENLRRAEAHLGFRTSPAA